MDIVIISFWFESMSIISFSCRSYRFLLLINILKHNLRIYTNIKPSASTIYHILFDGNIQPGSIELQLQILSAINSSVLFDLNLYRYNKINKYGYFTYFI